MPFLLLELSSFSQLPHLIVSLGIAHPTLQFLLVLTGFSRSDIGILYHRVC